MSGENSLSGLNYEVQPYSQQQQDNNPNQKEFQCPICMKFFSRKFTLDMHFLIHQGVKPHACPFCGKCFRQKGTLMRHKALHSSTALFHCNLCNRGFRQKNVFLHHLKHRHKVSTEKLDRRKCRTQLKGQNLINNLPPFALADSTAISSSDKHLEAMLLRSFEISTVSQSAQNTNILVPIDEIGGIQSHDSSDSNSRGYADLLVPETLDQKVIPDSSSTHAGITQQIWNSTGEQLITNSLTLQKKTVSYKCDFCMKLFASYGEYNEHIIEDHGNVELIDKKPIILSAPDGHIFSGTNSQTECETVSTSVYSTSDQSSAPGFERSESQHSITNSQGMGASSTSEMTFTCIPCQLDFNTEEDFECHVKTHVQSVLLSDSESVEMDTCQESLPSTTVKKRQGNKTGFSSTEVHVRMPNIRNQPDTSTSVIPDLKNTFRHPSSIEYSTSAVKARKSHNSSVSKAYLSSNVRKTLANTGDNQNKAFNNGERLPECDVEEFSHKSLDSGHSNKSKPSVKLIRRMSCTIRKVNSKTKNTSVVSSGDRVKKFHVLRVFMCPFCKKNCTSSKALCKHAKTHINSVFSRGKLHNDGALKPLNIKEPKRSNFSHKQLSGVVNKRALLNHVPTKSKSFLVVKERKRARARCSYQSGTNGCSDNFATCSGKNNSISVSTIDDKTNNANLKTNLTKLKALCKIASKGQKQSQCSSEKAPNFFQGDTPSLSFQNKKKFTCLKCSKTFKQEILYYYHQQMHLGVRNFSCHFCKKRFMKKDLLLKHTRCSHMKCYKCALCMKTFQYRILFEHHIKSRSNCCIVNNIESKDENICVPVVDLKKHTELKSQGVIGIIPVKGFSGPTDSSDRGLFSSLVGIPVLSFSQIETLSGENLPVVGSIDLSVKHSLGQ